MDDIRISEKGWRLLLNGAGERESQLLAELIAACKASNEGLDATIPVEQLLTRTMGKLCWTRTKVDVAFAALLKSDVLPSPENDQTRGGQASYRPTALIQHIEAFISAAVDRFGKPEPGSGKLH